MSGSLRLRTHAVLVLLAGCTGLQERFVAERDGSTPVRLELVGVGAVSRERIADRVREPLLELSRDLERGAAANAAQRITALYRSLGYPDVEVEHEVTRRENELTARFEVREGPRLLVESLVIRGNDSIDRETLLELWRRRPAGLLGLGKPLFVAADVERFAAAIAARYQAGGYLVATARAQTTRSPAGVDVEIRIEEGPLFEIRRVDVAPQLLAPLAGDAPPKPEGKTYSDATIQQYVLALRVGLRERGHPQPALEVLRGGDPKAAKVDVFVRGAPGPRVRVAEVVARGNERVPDGAIVGRLDLRPGEWFRGSVEDAAIRELYATGEFRRVRAAYEPLDGDRVRLVLEVEEPKDLLAQAPVGYGTYSRVRAGVDLEQRDVLASGLDARLRGRIHTRGRSAHASLVDPELIGTGVSLTAGASVAREVQPSYTDEVVRVEASLFRWLAFPLAARLGYAWETHDGSVYDAAVLARAVAEYEQGELFAELVHDRRDHPLLPRHGHRAFTRVAHASDGLGGDVDWLRAVIGGELHVPFGKRLAVAARGETGLLWAGDGSARVPLQERFFNGGERTVRSFRESQLGPKDAAGEPVGGEFRNVFSLEASYGLLAVAAGRRPLLAVALFGDAGNVGRRSEAWGLSGMRYAVGAGLRIVTPQGMPVQLDAAWNPDREPGEEEWVLHFQVGFPFEE